jgi:hypothetical protein
MWKGFIDGKFECEFYTCVNLINSFGQSNNERHSPKQPGKDGPKLSAIGSNP